MTPTITDRDFTIATIAAPAGMTEESEETSEAEAETDSTDTNNEE